MDKALFARVKKQAWFHRFPRGLPVLVFLLSSVATAISVIAIERADTRSSQLLLERNAAEVAAGIQQRASENMAVLSAAGALFGRKEEVTAQTFSNFVESLSADDVYHGSLGIGWARRVDTTQLWSFEEEMREVVGPGYNIRPVPDTSRRTATPIVYLQPNTQDNQSAIGYDMYSEATRRAAMDKAIKLGKPVASAKVHLVQDASRPNAGGFLIYMPVYEEGSADGLVRGFVYSPFNADEFLRSAATLYGDKSVDVWLYDQYVADENLLAAATGEGKTRNQLTVPIEVANHQWFMVVADKQPASLSLLSQVTILFGGLLALTLMALARMITRRAAEDRLVLEWLSSQASIRDSLTRELNHRVKNTLANVLSIVSLTKNRYDTIDEFVDALSGRIRGLSATHDILSQGNWGSATIGDIVSSELAPYFQGDDSHVDMEGPEIELAPNDAMSLGLAVHELATNAAKYGALSTSAGKVTIRWHLARTDRAVITWKETGGPAVVEPTTKGFGMVLIEKIVAHELKSVVEVNFEPDGLQCTIQVPVRRAQEFRLRTKHSAEHFGN